MRSIRAVATAPYCETGIPETFVKTGFFGGQIVVIGHKGRTNPVGGPPVLILGPITYGAGNPLASSTLQQTNHGLVLTALPSSQMNASLSEPSSGVISLLAAWNQLVTSPGPGVDTAAMREQFYCHAAGHELLLITNDPTWDMELDRPDIGSYWNGAAERVFFELDFQPGAV